LYFVAMYQSGPAPRVIYDHKGRKSREEIYFDGHLHGRWVMYYSDGSKMMQGCYERDEKRGDWTSFDESGRVEQVEVHPAPDAALCQ
jgi:antitoxin component YwqK of YwqJK toxin-antitoxin module